MALLLAVLWAFTGQVASQAEPGDAEATGPVLRLELGGAVTSATATQLRSALTQARKRKAPLLLVELDTPGGLLDATRDMVRQILESPLPVVVYVAPDGAHAGSAGLFLTLSAHVAAMVPASNLGAAHPVNAFGGDVDGDMRGKIVNDTAAWARSLAQQRGRNVEWAAKAVTESAALTASEALEAGIIDLVANDREQLLSALDGRTVRVRGADVTLSTRGRAVADVERSPGEALYDVLADPNLVYLLLLLGLAGLFVEFQQPGLWVPGTLGLTALVVVFFVQTMPLNSLGIGLIVTAVVLLVLEVYVTSLGLLTLAGMACLVAGSYMLFETPGGSIRLSPLLIWGVAIGLSALLSGIFVLLARAKLQGPTAGVETLPGQLATVHSAIRPGRNGKIFFDGSYWNASADASVDSGTTVRVVRIDGLLVHVEPVTEQAHSS